MLTVHFSLFFDMVAADSNAFLPMCVCDFEILLCFLFVRQPRLPQ